MSNVITAVMLLIFTDSYALKFYTYIQVSIQKEMLNSPTFWDEINSLNNSDLTTQQNIYQTFYWLNEGF